MVIPTQQSKEPSLDPWVLRELGIAGFGDARLTARALRLASDLAATRISPWRACTRAIGRRCARAIGFLITRRSRPKPHQAAIWERCADAEMVLLPKIRPINFTSHPATTGMGSIGPGSEQGFLLHSALALATDGVPLGLVGQIACARDPKTPKSQRRKQLPIEEKESYRWLQIQQQIAERVPNGT